MLQAVEHLQCLVDDIGDALDRHPPAAPLGARVRALRHEPRVAFLGDLAGEFEPVGAHRPAGEEDQRRLARAQDARRLGDGLARRRRGWFRRRHRHRARPVVPRRIGRQDQARDLARRRPRRGDRGGTVPGDRHRIGRGLDPVRGGPRQPLDIGGQGRVVLPVIGRMIADDVDHARGRLVGVVDVGEPVGEARPEMQQGRGRVVGHAVIAVGGAGHDALEQPQDAAHAVDPVERRDKMHLRGAGVREAHIDAAADQGPHQAFRAVHPIISAPASPRPASPLAPHPAGQEQVGQAPFGS